MAGIRYLEKLTSIDGASSVTLPIVDYEWESTQSLRTAFMESVGMDYAFDALRGAPALKAVATEVVRATIYGGGGADMDTILDNMRGGLLAIGRGKLYTKTQAGVRRWCYARLAGMPSIRVTGPALIVPVEIPFQRFSDWFAETPTSVITTVTTSPKSITVTNAGNIAAKFIVFRFRSSSAAGFTNPVLLNVTNGYQFSSTRDAVSVNSELKVDTEAMSVLWSNDDGVSYANDYALFTIGVDQAAFFQLEPGDNTLMLLNDGTPNLSFEVAFSASYA